MAFDLLTLELVWNVSRGTDNLPVNFGASANFRCQVMGKHASDWWYDLNTFDLWRHRACRRCKSLYSIPVPNLKFIGHPSTSALIGLKPWPLTSKWGHGPPMSGASFLLILSLLLPFHSWLRVRYGTDRHMDRETDGETDDAQQCFMSHSMWAVA